MKIEFDPAIEVKPGDFGDPVGKVFHVAEGLRLSFQLLGIRTADTLYSIAKSDPGALADVLHWTCKDVETANSELEASLLTLGRIDPGSGKTDLTQFGTGAGPVFKK